MWRDAYTKPIEWLREKECQRYLAQKRMRLRNQDFSIFASNCNGAFMYYDLGLQYLSPTVNLCIEINDFIKMAENLKWYMEQEIEKVEEKRIYPTGLLGDIEILFVHYKSYEEGKQIWEERKKRINWDNLFFVGTARGDLCTYDTIKRFDQLPYENKVIFTNKEYPEFQSAYCIKGFEKQKEVGILVDYKRQILQRRYLDDFDYVSFLNAGKNK